MWDECAVAQPTFGLHLSKLWENTKDVTIEQIYTTQNLFMSGELERRVEWVCQFWIWSVNGQTPNKDLLATSDCLSCWSVCLFNSYCVLREFIVFLSTFNQFNTKAQSKSKAHLVDRDSHFFFLNTCVQHNHGGDNQWDCLLLYESHNHASFTVKSDVLMFSIKTLNFHPTWLSNSLSVVCSLYYTKLSVFFSLCVMLCLWLIKTCVQLFYPKKLPTSQHRLPY